MRGGGGGVSDSQNSLVLFRAHDGVTVCIHSVLQPSEVCMHCGRLVQNPSAVRTLRDILREVVRVLSFQTLAPGTGGVLKPVFSGR